MPQTDSDILSELFLTFTVFRDFREHGPRMRIDDRSARAGRFTTCVSSSVDTGDGSLGRAPF